MNGGRGAAARAPMNSRDVAWIAGLLEGEGCFFWRKTARPKTERGARISAAKRHAADRMGS